MKKSPVENFPPRIPHDFFCGMARRNIPLSKYEIKKGGISTVLPPEIDFVEKAWFFPILELFDPLEARGGGSKF